MARPMGRTAGGPAIRTRSPLLNALLCRTTPPKKGGADRLLDATIHLARRYGLIGSSSELAAIDSTGLETRYVSAYYTRRCQRHKGHIKHRYPKLSAVCDTKTHLFLSAVVTRGPKPDLCEFEKTLTHAVGRQRIATLLGDAGYESEGAHRWCRNDLHIQSIFPTTDRGRRRHDGKPNNLTGYYRRQLRKNFPQETYGQRWQIETDFSMLKRLLGSAVRSRRRYAIDREILLRVMTINLMIILCSIICFQQSNNIPDNVQVQAKIFVDDPVP